jgi:hypothetical protein
MGALSAFMILLPNPIPTNCSGLHFTGNEKKRRKKPLDRLLLDVADVIALWFFSFFCCLCLCFFAILLK